MTTTYSNEQSKILYERASRSLAGGVGSMARGSGAGYQIPLYVTRGEGAHIYDVDENEYIDYLLALGPLIHGHRPPEVMAAVHKILDDSGPMLGLSNSLESEVAEMVQAAVPSAELVRFSNSGTEAVMMAIRLARAYTGKEKIIRFEGCFHGWSDIINVSVKPPIAAAGLEHAPRPVPAAPGIPESLLSTLIIQPWNNPEILEKTVRERKHEIAAIITEPLMANCGCVEAKPGYLAFLRQLASEHGIVLIFDEVVTGFRLALGGAQQYYGVTPDLTTMAKAIGGGFPLSAVGGKREIMQLAADNRVPYLGTYNTNSVVMAAAKATLAGLRKPGTYERMHKLGDRLKAGLRDVFARAGITVSLLGPGTVFQLWFTDKPPQNWREAAAAARPEWYGAFQGALLKQGVLVHPSQYEHWFISTVHTEADVDQTLHLSKKQWRRSNRWLSHKVAQAHHSNQGHPVVGGTKSLPSILRVLLHAVVRQHMLWQFLEIPGCYAIRHGHQCRLAPGGAKVNRQKKRPVLHGSLLFQHRVFQLGDDEHTNDHQPEGEHQCWGE